MNGPKPPVKARTTVTKKVQDDDDDDMDNLKSTYSMRITSTKSTTAPTDLGLSGFAPTPRTARKLEPPSSHRTLDRFSAHYDDDFRAEPALVSSSSADFKSARNRQDDPDNEDAVAVNGGRTPRAAGKKEFFHHRRRGDRNAHREDVNEEKENNFTSPRFRKSIRDRHPATASHHASSTASSFVETATGDTLHRRAVIPVSPRKLSIDESGSENDVGGGGVKDVYPNSEFRTPRNTARDSNQAPTGHPLFIPSLDLEGKFSAPAPEPNSSTLPLTGIFSLDNRSVDLILDEKCLKWKFINGKRHHTFTPCPLSHATSSSPSCSSSIKQREIK